MKPVLSSQILASSVLWPLDPMAYPTQNALWKENGFCFGVSPPSRPDLLCGWVRNNIQPIAQVIFLNHKGELEQTTTHHGAAEVCSRSTQRHANLQSHKFVKSKHSNQVT